MPPACLKSSKLKLLQQPQQSCVTKINNKKLEYKSSAHDQAFFIGAVNSAITVNMHQQIKEYLRLGYIDAAFKPKSKKDSFDSIEFYGDQILYFILNKIMRTKLPKEYSSSGWLTSLKSKSTKNSTLILLYDHLQLDRLIDKSEVSLKKRLGSKNKWKADIVECMVDELFDHREHPLVIEFLVLLTFFLFKFGLYSLLGHLPTPTLSSDELKEISFYFQLPCIPTSFLSTTNQKLESITKVPTLLLTPSQIQASTHSTHPTLSILSFDNNGLLQPLSLSTFF